MKSKTTNPIMNNQKKVWISEAFEKVEEHLVEQDNKITDIQYRLDRMDGKLEVILEHLIKISDLPEE